MTARILNGQSGDGYEALPLNYANVGATGLFSTASDLAHWLDNFREPKICERAAIAKLQEQAVLTKGKSADAPGDAQKIDYALGLGIGNYRGLKTIMHGGGDAGYRSFVLWFPEQELGIAVLSGFASLDSGKLANQVAEVFLGDKLAPDPSKPARKYITLNPKAVEQFVGHYKLDGGPVMEIANKDGKLVGEVPDQGTQELHPLGTNRFFVEQLDSEIEFIMKPGSPMSLKIQQDGRTVITAERTTLTPWKPADPKQYQGVYWSDELETQYTISLKEGKLSANHIRHGEIPLTPSGPDRFKTTEWFMPEAAFQRDSSNHISGVTFGGRRITGIRFVLKH